jgi:hypothetical protein
MKQTMKSLPPELWQMILKIKHQTFWIKYKKYVHKKLQQTIIPCCEHRTRFVFRDYEVSYFRTNHIEFTVTVRRGNTQINQVIYIYTENKELLCHETRFYYPPTYFLN